jgi:CRISPR-associated endonuclease/helicase Cas3
LTYPPGNEKPYHRDELNAASQFLAQLGSGDISQRQLAEALERHAPKEPPTDDSAKFLESGYYAVRGELREIDDFSAPCLLTTDLDLVKTEYHDRHQPLDGFIVNVPNKYRLGAPDVSRPQWLPGYLDLANGNLYCKRRGFMTE